ncbi:Thumpd2 [Symbiodinium natans]|uniref:Thumpd2 protein n=1 Tax=Symbiodinium natans TaxID=878477 RepID=A0A812NDJ7_9DINO|nr:Thumpd2 [Symbiodinium natans]
MEPQRSRHFFGTVDTGVGNGPAVYKACVSALERIGATGIEVMKGRVHWSCPLDADLQSLRCFEKVFLSAFRGGPGEWEAAHGESLWEEEVNAWSQLCGRVRSFRVSCKRSGRKDGASSLAIERSIGAALQDRFGWTLDLRVPHLEVWIFAVEEETCGGLLLLRQLESKPVYSSATGLHPNVAWALVSAAGVQPGEVLLDPMCGTGMLLTEAPKSSYVVGSDIDPDMIRRASEHFRALRHPRWALLRADATRLPLPDAFADVVVCDLPFGRQFGSVEGNKELYPKLLREFHRVTKPTGRCLLLTAAENEAALAQAAAPWSMVAKASWKLGNKLPAIVVALTPSARDATYALDMFNPKAGRFALQRKALNPELRLCSSFGAEDGEEAKQKGLVNVPDAPVLSREVGSDISNANHPLLALVAGDPGKCIQPVCFRPL